ncbi:MAG: SWIB/MDM2 domain-containing protein [Myxococcaceae bacterium]|nr:SWIB/MDM2 domain-containing protein [Myxococcaceae bacterium]
MAAKKTADKKPAAKKSAPKNSAFTQEFEPTPELAALVGSKPLPRTQAIKKLWEYFKKNKLNEGQVINMDDKMKAVYGAKKARKMGKNQVAVGANQIFMTEVSEAFKHLKK